MKIYKPSDNVIKTWKDKDIEAFKQAVEEDDEAIFMMLSEYYDYLKTNYGLWREGFEWLCELDMFEDKGYIILCRDEYRTRDVERG